MFKMVNGKYIVRHTAKVLRQELWLLQACWHIHIHDEPKLRMLEEKVVT